MNARDAVAGWAPSGPAQSHLYIVERKPAVDQVMYISPATDKATDIVEGQHSLRRHDNVRLFHWMGGVGRGQGQEMNGLGHGTFPAAQDQRLVPNR
jgi:hypothetical protein